MPISESGHPVGYGAARSITTINPNAYGEVLDLIIDGVRALKKRHARKQEKLYGVTPTQIMPYPPEVQGLPFEASMQLIWTDRASAAGAYQASLVPKSPHAAGETTNISYSQLTPEVAREVDRVMRHPTDPHDRT